MKKIPRILFAHLPTPIEPMPNLGAFLNGPKLWVKRDDQTGLAFGGNKTRKLEFLLAEAMGNGAKTLITGGAIQSNHCRQTAAVACRYGFDCVLVLSKSAELDPSEALNGNLLLDYMFGAEVVWTSRQNRDLVLKETFDDLWNHGRRPYLIPYGGSNATGALAYTLALQELHQQVSLDQNMRFPDTIIFASSSGGTQAGLVAGKNIYHHQVNILGISIDETEEDLKNRVRTLAEQVCELAGEEVQVTDDSIQVNAGYLGAGYGIMGDAEKEAIHLFARKEGILLDPVYTGRAAAGLIDLISKGFFKKSETVLFWHTGGGPALFAPPYHDQLID